MTMNKYLVKIAKEVNPDKDYLSETAGIGGGGYLLHKAYHSGDLTGRATYYHGSTKDVAEKIKEEGIVPRKSKGIIDHIDGYANSEKDHHVPVGHLKNFSKKNEDLAFATKTKNQAHFYAAQADDIRRGTFKLDLGHRMGTAAEGARRHIRDSLFLKKDEGLTKLNIPTWKHEVKSKIVQNPETENMPKFAPGYKELNEDTMTHKGTIPPKWVRGSRHYQANSTKEIGSYIKKNTSRFAKGALKAAIGAGLAGMSLRSAYKKSRDE